MTVRLLNLRLLPAACRKARLFQRACRLALGAKARRAGELSLVFMTNPQLRRVNKRFLKHDYDTDVVSFPGTWDVLVSVDQAKRQAKELGHPLLKELLTLAVHGTLHLMGHDDRKPAQRHRMFARQDRIVSRVLASALSVLLAALAPGLAPWDAAAQTTRAQAPARVGLVPAFGASSVAPFMTPLPSVLPVLLAPAFQAALPGVSMPESVPLPAMTLSLVPPTPSPPAGGEAVGGTSALPQPPAPALQDVLSGRDVEGGLNTLYDSGRRGAQPVDDPAAAPDVPWAHDHDSFFHGHDHGHEPDSPVPAPEPSPAQKKDFRFYSLGVAAVKVGIETLHLAVPLLLLTQSGAAALVGALFVASDLAGIAAGWAAGPLIDRIRPSRLLAGVAAVQTAAIGVIPLFVTLGAPVTMLLLAALFVFNGALAGAFDVARRAALPQIVGRDEGTLREFNGRLYFRREIAAVLGVLAAGWWMQSAGYLASLWVFPLFYLPAAWLFSRIKTGEGASLAPRHEGPGFLGSLSRGAKAVWKDPVLRAAALLNIPVLALHKLFHALLAVVYATQILGNPALAAVIIGAWNAGELAAAGLMQRLGRQAGSGRWLRASAAAGLSAWALWAFPTIWVAAPVAFLLAAATLGNELGLSALFQSRAPKEDLGAVMGFAYSVGAAFALLSVLGLGHLFDAVGASTGFLLLAAVLTGISVLFLLASRTILVMQDAVRWLFSRLRPQDPRD